MNNGAFERHIPESKRLGQGGDIHALVGAGAVGETVRDDG